MKKQLVFLWDPAGEDPDYALDGIVHNYYDPTWSWDGTSAQVTFKCGCGQTTVLTQEDGVSVTESDRKDATCVDAGAVTYLAELTLGQQKYSNTKTVTLPAGTGHSMVGTQSCEEGSNCRYCDYALPALGHKWAADASLSTAATCTVKAAQGYRCGECGQTKTVELEGSAGHKYEYLQELDKGNCLFVKQYRCSVCRDTVEGTAQSDSYYKHSYTASLTKEATCVSEGQKTYSCSVCPDAEVYWIGCECGQNRYLAVKSMSCDMEELEPRYETGPNGGKVTVWRYGCTKCQLISEDAYYSQTDKATCLTKQISYTALLWGQTPIAESRYAPYEEYHMTTEDLGEVDLTDQQYGLCGEVLSIEGCSCGKQTWTYSYQQCMWNYDYTNSTDTLEQYTCVNCGAVKQRVIASQKGDTACQLVETTTCTYFKNGKQVYTYTNVSEYEEHSYEVTDYQLQGNSCEDGIVIERTCADCGDVDKRLTTGHEIVHETVTDLSGYDVCAKAVVQGTCACDQAYQECYLKYDGDKYCQWYYEDENHQVCDICGMTEEDLRTYGEKDEDCFCRYTETVKYTDKNGKVIATGIRSGEITLHNMVQSGELLGDSCEDGVVITNSCTDCGYSYSYTNTYHETLELQKRDLTDLDMCCTSITVWGCLCGQNTYLSWSGEGCQWVHTAENEGFSEQHCTVCGITRQERWQYQEGEDSCHNLVDNTVTLLRDGVQPVTVSYTRVETNHKMIFQLTLLEGTTCQVKGTDTQTYRKNGAVLFTTQRSYTSERHQYVYSYRLLGQTCDDGYYITRTCALCGYSYESDSLYTGCSTREVERELLHDGTGICGPIQLIHSSCACGQQSHCETYIGCRWNYTGYDEQLDMNAYHCDGCGADWYYGESGQRNPETCMFEGVERYLWVLDGETVLDARIPVSYERHIHQMVSAEFDVPGGDCEGGVTVYMQCVSCGESYTNWNNSHSNFEKKRFELKDLGACGGWIVLDGCACGKYAYLDWVWDCHMTNEGDYDGDDSQGTGWERYTCDTCGLQILREQQWSVPENNCFGQNQQTITVTMGSTVETIEYTSTAENHDYIHTYVLENGKTSCEDGLTVYATCSRCDYSNSWNSYGHETYVNEIIDLAAYGSVCGATLEHHTCACGYANDYRLGEDIECDIYAKDTEIWIDGAIDDAQYTTQGWVTSYSYAYSEYCAVTDPACGLKLRRATYWLVENCMATQYETWQLGYDEATGTCQREITVATGEKHAYHNYETTSINEAGNQGVAVQGTLYTCTDCGSTFAEKYYYDTLTNDMVKREAIGTNTLDNGERKDYHDITEYMQVDGVNGYGYANVTGIGVHFTVPAELELKGGQWLVDGTVTDVNLQKNQAVWASDAAVDMTQKTQVMKLTFQVLELEAGQTELQCDVVFDKLTVEDSYAKVSLDPVTASVAVSMPSGDMNADGEVNDADALYLLRYTLFPDRYPIFVGADVNSDGETNDADALYLLRYTLFPERYPLYPNQN